MSNTDGGTPLLETLSVLDNPVNSGKVRHIRVSNKTPWGLMKFLQPSQAHNLPRPVSMQNPYRLINRTFEIGLAEIVHRESCALLAHSPLGFWCAVRQIPGRGLSCRGQTHSV